MPWGIIKFGTHGKNEEKNKVKEKEKERERKRESLQDDNEATITW